MNEEKLCKICETKLTLDENGDWRGVHPAYCIQCEICEKQFQKHSILHFETDRKFYACETCGLQEQVSHYRLKYEKAKDSIDIMRTELNLYKSVLLNPATMAAKADDPTSAQPSIQVIRQRLTGIENFTIDQMTFWLETFELYAREIASHLGKKASREEIKEHLANKTKKAITDAAKRQEQAKVKTNEVKTFERLTDEQKAVKGFMKLPGMTKDNAQRMYDEMMNAMKGIKK